MGDACQQNAHFAQPFGSLHHIRHLKGAGRRSIDKAAGRSSTADVRETLVLLTTQRIVEESPGGIPRAFEWRKGGMLIFR